jgi:hypothetical protein
MKSSIPSASIDLYLNFMHEIKGRLAVLLHALEEGYGLSKPSIHEFGYLQLRMICELIALSTLVANGNVPATQSGRMTKAYQADWILNAMEKAHPDFYPLPLEKVKHADESVTYIVSKIEHLTKRDLVKLYAECGRNLHRGSLRTAGWPFPRELERIRHHSEQIMSLLYFHKILLFDSTHEIWVHMHDANDPSLAVKKAGVRIEVLQRLGRNTREGRILKPDGDPEWGE